jgi:hypothetical protein
MAMNVALRWILAQDLGEVRVVIVSDCKSVLQTILGTKTAESRYLGDLVGRCLLTADLYIIWCPSHVGIVINEEADKLANRALTYDHDEVATPISKFLPSLVCERADREVSLGYLDIVEGMELKHKHLKWSIPRLKTKLQDNRRLEWWWTRLRLNRVPWTQGTLTFCINNRCAQCPEEVQSAFHFLADCPFNGIQREQLFSRLCITLEIPFPTLETLLSLGRNITTKISKMRECAEAMAEMIETTIALYHNPLGN